MLPVKKIYIDSKFKTPDSKSTSDFKFELKETILLPQNTIAYIDNLTICHSWYSVEENINDKLYIQVTSTETDPQLKPNICAIVQLAKGNYNITTLATEIALKANNAFATAQIPTHFNITMNIHENTFTLSPAVSTVVFKILTDYDLKNGLPATVGGWNSSWTGPAFDYDTTCDINEMMNNFNTPSPFYNSVSFFQSSYVDLQYNKNIYLHSPNLSTFSTIGVLGERTVIKKIPVSVGNNEMIIDQITSSSDWLDVSRMTLKTIQFQIKNVKGQIIPLHNANVSLSIVFDKYRESIE